METATITPLVDQNTPAFVAFLAGAEKIAVEHTDRIAPNVAAQRKLVFLVREGASYLHVLRGEQWLGQQGLSHLSSHCFVNRLNGDVLKSGGMRPAKGARGNIFDATGGLGRMGPYGAGHNR